MQGGLHGAKARQALLSDYSGYSHVHCIVYCGLTDEEALRLAARHNINGHYNHKMTHRDYVRSYFITLLFLLSLLRGDIHSQKTVMLHFVILAVFKGTYPLQMTVMSLLDTFLKCGCFFCSFSFFMEAHE